MTETHPELEALQQRQAEEDEAYAALLAELDRLASYALPLERLPDQPAVLARVNGLWQAPGAPGGTTFDDRLARKTWDLLKPVLDQQTAFNSLVVQLLNGHLDEAARVDGHLRTLVAVLVRWIQRVLPLVDARDRVAGALATTRSELILEVFERRMESLGRRVAGLSALVDRIEAVSAEVTAVRQVLTTPPAVAPAVVERAVQDAVYVGFENRFRGDDAVLAARMAEYAVLFAENGADGPVADLGCGRGEFLRALRERGIAGRGVEGNAAAVSACRAHGLDVEEGDLLAWLRRADAGSLGGVFAAQVVEHLPPPVLQEMLGHAHRVLRPGGLLVLETVNVRSVVAFLEVYNRDLTHVRPLHSETLRYLAAAAGFADARIDLHTPVGAASRLQPIPTDGLPERAAAVLNENVDRLNELLYGPLEYALVARR